MAENNQTQATRVGPVERYLGDGVYATFDGYQIWLRADRDGFTHRIAIECGVMNSLTDYADAIWTKNPCG